MNLKIFKNFSYLFLAQLGAKFVAFLYTTIFLSRHFDPATYGVYAVALSYFTIISSLADFGISRFLIREISHDHTKSSLYIGPVLLIRVVSASVIFLLSALAIYLFDPQTLRAGLSIIAIAAIIPQMIGITVDNFFSAIQKFSVSALGILVLSISNAIIGVILVSHGTQSFGAVISVFLSQCVYALLLLYFFRLQGISWQLKIARTELIRILKGSFPYALLGVLGLLYFRVDTVLLSYIRGDTETGYYSLAYKFIDAVIFIPSAFGAVFFPYITRVEKNLREGTATVDQLKKIYYKSIAFMGAMGVGITILYIVILPIFIHLYLHQYLNSIQAITILAFTVPFMFIHNPGVQIILATDKYLNTVLWLSVVTLLFNLILNLIFIPQYGYIAASWITVASEAFSFLVF